MAIKFSECHDISVVLGAESIDYPGDTPFSRELVGDLSRGANYNLSRLVASCHSGTHLDAPSHFLEFGKSVDDYSLERFILKAHVVHVGDATCVSPQHVATCDLRPGEAVLFRTANSDRRLPTSGRFTADYVHISPNAAQACVEKGASLVGLDFITVEQFGIEGFPTHLTLMSGDVVILESLNLFAVPPGRYTLICLPLRIKGAEGSPVRAVLLR